MESGSMQPRESGEVPATLVGILIGAGIAFLIRDAHFQRLWAEYDPVAEAQSVARRALGIE